MRRGHSELHFGSGGLAYTRVVHPSVTRDPHLRAGPAASKDASASASEHMPLQPAGCPAKARVARTDTHTRPLGRRAERGREGPGRLPPLLNDTPLALVYRSAALSAPFVCFLSRSEALCVRSHGAVLTSRVALTEPE